MSILKQFIELRDQFTNYGSQNIDFLNEIVNNDFTGHKSVIVDGGDKWLDIQRIGSLIYVDLVSTDGIDNVLSSTSWDASSEPGTGLSKELICSDTNESFKLGDLLNDASDASDTYILFANLASKFSYTSKMKYSDIIALEKGYNSDLITRLNDTLFSLADEDGAISQRNFLVACKLVFDNSKDAVDSGSAELDTSSPFTLQTTLSIVMSGISSALSLILTALSLAFGGIVAVIGIIFSAISNLFGKITENAFDINYDNLNGLINGPLVAAELKHGYQEDGFTHVSDSLYTYLPHNRDIHYCESFGIAMFYWWNEDYSRVRVNCYEYPCIDPYKFYKLLAANGCLSNPDGPNLSINLQTLKTYDGDNMLIDNIFELCKYPDGYTCGNTELALSLLASYIFRVLRGTPVRFNYNDSEYPATYVDFSNVIITFDQSQAISFAGDDEKLYDAFAHMVFKFYHINGNYHSFADLLPIYGDMNYANVYSTSDIIESLARVYSGVSYDHLSSPYGQGYTYNNGVRDVTILGYDSDYHGHYLRPRSQLLGTDIITQDMEHMITQPLIEVTNVNDSIANFIPRSTTYSWPISLAGDINRVIGIAAIVTTAVAIAASQIKKVIAKKQISKKAFKVGQLNKKREAYLNDPNNDALRIDFEDSVYRYNKLGRLFGYGTYDAANGWSDSGSSDSKQSTILTNLMANNSSDDDALTTILQKLDTLESLIHTVES